MLENWVGILGWWMHVPGAMKPEPTDLRAWQRFVSDNLEFRLGVAVGAVVAQSWSTGAGDPLTIPSLESWRETAGLPWFGFWARELLRWGTLDPFVAFALAQGRARTRDEAVLLRIDFDAWLSQEFDRPTSEDHIDPQLFLRWERELLRQTRDDLDEEPEAARLTGTTGSRRTYGVLPVVSDGGTRWLDPAGYELARSDDGFTVFDARDLHDDFVLDASGVPSVDRVFRRRARR